MHLKLFLLHFSAFVFSSVADDSFDVLWKAYQTKYSKVYELAEFEMRRSIFERNANMVAKHNLEADFGLQSYRIELNKFSDMTLEELHQYRTCVQMGRPKSTSNLYESGCGRNCKYTLPPSVDWRKKGLVTEVKDQGACGSCWAFSSTGALEGQHKKKTGSLVSLSEQNLVDCSFKQGNEGCDGGWMDSAFKYVIDNRGIDTEKAYGYVGEEGRCSFKRSAVGANCTGYHSIRKGSESDLQAAVAEIGPISVAIDATDKFMYYKSGVFSDFSCSSSEMELDHAVLVVGYGSQNGKDYWIVKNSWAIDWGMDGYILMSRNKKNQCGIATHAVYPIV